MLVHVGHQLMRISAVCRWASLERGGSRGTVSKEVYVP